MSEPPDSQARVRTALEELGATMASESDIAETWTLPNGAEFRCARPGLNAPAVQSDYWRQRLNALRQAHGGLLPGADDEATKQKETAGMAKKRRKVTDEDVKQIVEMRARGVPVTIIAKKLGRAATVIHRVLKTKGLASKPKRAAANPGTKAKLRTLFGFTWIGWLNLLVLQWCCIRLAATWDSDTGEWRGYRILKFVAPMTGWGWWPFPYYKFVRLRRRAP